MDRPEFAVLAVTQTTLTFLTLLPKPDELLSADPASGYANSVRVSEIAAVTVSLGIGLVLSFIAKEKEPLLLAAVTALGMAAAVEYLTRKTTPEAMVKDVRI